MAFSQDQNKPTAGQLAPATAHQIAGADSTGVLRVLQTDTTGALVVSGSGSSSVVKIEDSSGNALNSNGSGALNVAVVSGGGSNASVGTVGSTVPTSATTLGVQNNSGNLVVPSSTNPVRIDPTGTTVQPVSATSLPLPTNAAQETGGNLANISSSLSASTPKGFHISSNAVQSIKSSAGTLRGYFLDNTANSVSTYYQFFNVASGSVTLGTTASLFVIPVPAGQAANLTVPPSTFSTAMSFAATTTYNGSTAPASATDCTIWSV